MVDNGSGGDYGSGTKAQMTKAPEANSPTIWLARTDAPRLKRVIWTFWIKWMLDYKHDFIIGLCDCTLGIIDCKWRINSTVDCNVYDKSYIYTNKSANQIESAFLVRDLMQNMWPRIFSFTCLEKNIVGYIL